MLKDRPFRVAFLFSIGLHSVLLSPLSSFLNHPAKIQNTNIEVTYIAIEEEKALATKPAPITEEKVSLKEEGPTPKEVARPKKVEAKDPKETTKKRPDKDRVLTKEAFINKEVIDLNSIYMGDGQSDSLNYLRSIRKKINLYVHRNYDPPMGEGEAFLHFVLNPNGSVHSAAIISDNFERNERLRNLCLDSIYRSSPFKPFPKKLGLPRAAFKISISFKK